QQEVLGRSRWYGSGSLGAVRLQEIPTSSPERDPSGHSTCPVVRVARCDESTSAPRAGGAADVGRQERSGPRAPRAMHSRDVTIDPATALRSGGNLLSRLGRLQVATFSLRTVPGL